MRALLIISLLFAGCSFGVGEHRGYTCVAMQTEAAQVVAILDDMRIQLTTLEVEGETKAAAVVALAASIDKAAAKSTDLRARAQILGMDLGYTKGIAPLIPSDADKQMTLGHAGIATRRHARRVWWRKLPEKMVKSVVDFSGTLLEQAGTVIVSKIPWWLRWALWLAAIAAVVFGILAAYVWIRARWYKSGLATMVKLADDEGVPKEKLRDATRGTAGQNVYRWLRDRGELGNGRSSDVSTMAAAGCEGDETRLRET